MVVSSLVFLSQLIKRLLFVLRHAIPNLSNPFGALTYLGILWEIFPNLRQNMLLEEQEGGLLSLWEDFLRECELLRRYLSFGCHLFCHLHLILEI